MSRRKARQEAARLAAGSGPTGSGGDASGDTGSGESALARSAPPAARGRGSPAPAGSDGSGAPTGRDSGSVAPGGPAPPAVPPLGALFDDLFADCLAEPDASGPFWDAFSMPLPPCAPPTGAAALAWPSHAPAAMQLPAALAALPWLAPARVELKLGGDAAPTHLPPSFAAAAAASLFLAPPLAMTAAAQPGCTLLTLEAAVERERTGDACDLQAGLALQQLLRHQGAGPYLRRVDAVALAAAGTVARATRGVVKETSSSASSDAQPAAPRLPPLAVLAALRDAPAAVLAAAPLPASRGVRVRWHGHFLRADCDDASAAVPAGHLRLAVPDGIVEGVALLERAGAVPDEDGISVPRGAPRPILLSADVAVVAELNATAVATSGDEVARDAAEEAAILLGHAMRPGCAPQLAASAGGRCVQQGWAAAAMRCAALLPAGSEHAPALAAALLGAFGGNNETAEVAAAELAVAWLRASPRPAADSSESVAAAAMRAQLRAAAPLARSFAAAAAESHGVHYPPHVAEVASAELASRAASASPDARIVAALAAAQLRAAAAAWERAQAAEAEPEATIVPASVPPPDLDALARELAAAAPPEVLSEAAFRFRQYTFSIELFAVYLIAYHAAQAVRGSTTMPALDGRGEGVRLQRPHILAIMDAVRHRLLWIQAPTTALLLLLLCRRPWRALLAARLQPLLALQFAVHAVYATHEQAEMAQIELFAPAGIATVLLPLRFAAGLASFTLLCAWCCPLAPRWALPLFAARAAMPVLNAAWPRAAALMWPPTGGAGVALQCAACCAAAAHVMLRERRLRAEYEHYRTTAAAPRRRSKTD